ncbi:hypothetical protein ABT093_04920 [Kitasatospora sp. NPDC002551]|uniref:hypothetical protein n=1 Tax=unclassified Kitasatospora TaxID=2633591 RepID=UPI00332E86FF
MREAFAWLTASTALTASPVMVGGPAAADPAVQAGWLCTNPVARATVRSHGFAQLPAQACGVTFWSA